MSQSDVSLRLVRHQLDDTDRVLLGEFLTTALSIQDELYSEDDFERLLTICTWLGGARSIITSVSDPGSQRSGGL